MIAPVINAQTESIGTYTANEPNVKFRLWMRRKEMPA